MIKNKAKGTK